MKTQRSNGACEYENDSECPAPIPSTVNHDHGRRQGIHPKNPDTDWLWNGSGHAYDTQVHLAWTPKSIFRCLETFASKARSQMKVFTFKERLRHWKAGR